MNCIQVNTGTPYQVLIRRGILQDAGEEVKKVKPYARLAVVTDSNVSPLYLRNLLDSLERAGYKNILSFTTNPLSCSKIDFALPIILTTCSSIL